MPIPLKLSASLITTPAGAVIRVVNTTDWSTAPFPRASWALLLSAAQLGSVQAQDQDLAPTSYDARLFQSTGNPVETVDVPLPRDGTYRVRAVAVPLLASSAAYAAATVGRLYYQVDTAQFVVLTSATTVRAVLTWADVLVAAQTDNGTGADAGNLLDKSADAYCFNDYATQGGLGQLNLAYLTASGHARGPLVAEYVNAQLLISGAAQQFKLGYYADAATSATAAQRVLGAVLPGFAQSLPALPTSFYGNV